MPDSSPKPALDADSVPSDSERRQRNRMLLAVFLLLFAVGVLLVKDWTSLFPAADDVVSSESPDAAGSAAPADPPSSAAPADTGPATPPITQRAPAVEKKQRKATHTSTPPATAVNAPASHNGVIVNRRVLPPLRVEVVAGNRSSQVHPGSPSMRVNLDTPTPAEEPAPAPTTANSASTAAASPDPPLTTASDRVRMSDGADLEVQRATQPDYPMLARQMKVQGSVILEAMIGKDGGIQDLQVLHGPSILADAARQAVRQWRFKPYLQDGQPVETQAHITVNFTISTN